MSQTHSHHTTAVDNYQMEIARWNTGRNVLVFAALLGIIGCVAGYFTNPARLFQSYTVAFAYTTLIGLGAFFFVMIQFLTGSAWSVTMRRIMENVMITLPVGLVMTRAIRDYRERTGQLVGLKPAGGIRSAKDSLDWLALIKDELGDRWLRPDLFRFGASSLLTDIERQLEHFVTGRYSAAHRHPMA